MTSISALVWAILAEHQAVTVTSAIDRPATALPIGWDEARHRLENPDTVHRHE